MIASVLAAAAPIVSGIALMLVRKDSIHRYVLGGLLIMFGVGVFFLNPATNVMTSFFLDDNRLSRMEKACLGRNAETLFRYRGKPDDTWTNEQGTYVRYRSTSAFWSMWQQDTMVLLSNGVAVEMWHDD